MKLANLKEYKKKRKWFIPLFTLLVLSLFLSSGVSAAPVYKLNNTFFDPNYETNPGVLSELIYPWVIKDSHSGDPNSYVGPTALILYPNEGIQYPYPVSQIPSEFNFTSRMYFLTWPTTDYDMSLMFQLCSQMWNTGGSGYVEAQFGLFDKYTNGTYRFVYTADTTTKSIYVETGSSYVYTLIAHCFYNATTAQGQSYYNFKYELSTTEPGDEHYVNTTLENWRYGLGGLETVYIRLGGYSGSQYSSTGYTWIKHVQMWWENGITPGDTSAEEQSVVISNLVKQIVFFIPILVLTSLFGRIGFMGGVGLMAVIWIFSNPDFLSTGIMMFIALGIFTYKGGIQ